MRSFWFQSFCPLCRVHMCLIPTWEPSPETQSKAPSQLSSPWACLLLLLYLGPAEYFLTRAVKLLLTRSSLVFAVKLWVWVLKRLRLLQTLDSKFLRIYFGTPPTLLYQLCLSVNTETILEGPRGRTTHSGSYIKVSCTNSTLCLTWSMDYELSKEKGTYCHIFPVAEWHKRGTWKCVFNEWKWA